MNYQKLPLVLMRTGLTPEVPSAPGAPAPMIDPSVTTAPFTAIARLGSMLPVLGMSTVRHHIVRSISALRLLGALPIPVLVPFAVVSDDPESEPALRAFLFVPDPPDSSQEPGEEGNIAIGTSSGGGGWIMSEERWDGRLERTPLSGVAALGAAAGLVTSENGSGGHFDMADPGAGTIALVAENNSGYAEGTSADV